MSAFPNTQVVDANGQPLVVFHATTTPAEDFGEFDLDRTRPGLLGCGFCFTRHEQTLQSYSRKEPRQASSSGEQPIGRIIAVELNIERPKTDNMLTDAQVHAFFDALEIKVFPNGYDATQGHEQFRLDVMNTSKESRFDYLRSVSFTLVDNHDWVRGMKAMGYDGVIMEVFGSPEYVALEPNQIRVLSQDVSQELDTWLASKPSTQMDRSRRQTM